MIDTRDPSVGTEGLCALASPALFCAALALLGAFGLGVALGRRLRRSELSDARDAAEMWRALANELHRENGLLRCERTPAPCASEPPSGAPNALHRLDFGRGEVAQALGIPVADVETLEHTRLGLLEVFVIEQYVGALGCRLDVVAQHVDGEAIWLSSEGGAS